MDFLDLMEELKTVLEEMDGEDITKIFNQVSDRQVEYKGDSVWEYTGETTTMSGEFCMPESEVL